MTYGRRQTAAALCAALALAAAGCGSDRSDGEPLPPNIQEELDPRLTSIAERVANGSAGACDDIYASEADGGDFAPIDDTLERIPERVDADVRAALGESVDRLKRLVDDACEEIRGAEEEDTTTDEPIVEEPAPETTETAPPETTETTPPETTETTPPDEPTTPPTETGGGTGGTGGETGAGTGGGTGGTGPGQGGGPTGDGPPGQGGGLEVPE